MFFDKVEIFVKAGDGGNGMVSFRHEKYIPYGGPNGGDGGNGGNIIFIVDKNLNNLNNFRVKKKFIAFSGENGFIKNMHGKNGKDLYIKVPLGTIIIDSKNNKILDEFIYENQKKIFLKGGKGGFGNKHFANSINRVPMIAEKGFKGKYKQIILELKILADVGLLGMPSVGKSSFLSIVSNAKSRIGMYFFTTLFPKLGVVNYKNKFIIADLPGIIKNAYKGIGLGLKFLKHIERTKIILHMIDMSGGLENKDPYENFLIINNELYKYNKKLLSKKQIIVANKMDLKKSKSNIKNFKKKIKFNKKYKKYKIFEISNIYYTGINLLIKYIYKLLYNNY